MALWVGAGAVARVSVFCERGRWRWRGDGHGRRGLNRGARRASGSLTRARRSVGRGRLAAGAAGLVAPGAPQRRPPSRTVSSAGRNAAHDREAGRRAATARRGCQADGGGVWRRGRPRTGRRRVAPDAGRLRGVGGRRQKPAPPWVRAAAKSPGRCRISPSGVLRPSPWPARHRYGRGLIASWPAGVGEPTSDCR